MNEFLQRYSPSQQKTIAEYWDMVRHTRKTGSISDGIKNLELKYWDSFDKDVVIDALVIHIDRYQDKKENYTRGIIRNLAAERVADSNAPTPGRTSRVKKSRFANFQGREIDYDVIEHLEMLNQTGQLDAKRDELLQNPRYAKYL